MLLVVPGAASAGRTFGAAGSGLGPDTPKGGAPVYTNWSYNSSVDGFPLSYGEILPAGFVPAHSYPLLVYFHGEGKSPTVVPGGSGDGLARWNDSTLSASRILVPLVMNASTSHFIIIAPSPRSSEGFYTNSSCGGPEEQDTLDAIVLEQARHHISALYALGFSMGSMGAFAFVGHHPTMFRGLAVTGPITDAFESIAYHPSLQTGLLSLSCGVFPGPLNASANALYSYLSVPRFHPQNFSGIPIWVSAGGLDRGAPDNTSIWPYMQVNDTFVNSTCLVAGSFGEPANCTQPFSALAQAYPAEFSYRFIFEPGAGHTMGQLEPRDMFQFFLGRLLGGCFTSTFPPTINTPCP